MRCSHAAVCPRAVSLQLQLTDTTLADASTPPRGSLELFPSSHRPDAAHGHPEAIRAAVADPSLLTRVDVAPGTATLYSSRLWHRGGANEGMAERLVCFLTLGEPEAPAPPGLVHTMAREDVGAWRVGARGLIRQ